MYSIKDNQNQKILTKIKTVKSYKRFEKAIRNTLTKFTNKGIEDLVLTIFEEEGLSTNCLIFLFWNASKNNELLNYLNTNVYFPAVYSGRVSFRKDEVVACLRELKQTELDLKKWSDSTIDTTASKYMTLLKKFKLMKGGKEKTIEIPYLSEKGIIFFVYWLLAIETKSNLLESIWLKYCFLEKKTFIKQVMQKKFIKYFNIEFSGNSLKIKPIFSYKELYNEIQ